ncbi:MAG: metallophosphoesterase [bacterium]|nr:metallophosphoesterase [bacterium]
MIGIISDTHDNVVNVQKAVALFKEKNVEFVIHLGDVVAPRTIQYFSGLTMKFVKGNCDGADYDLMMEKIAELGAEYYDEWLELDYKGKKLVALHGKDEKKLQSFIESGKFDYVLHGHTHVKRDEKKGNTRIINPGAHYFGGENNIAFLDVETDNLEFIEL